MIDREFKRAERTGESIGLLIAAADKAMYRRRMPAATPR
jgi:hypothetical protein